MSDMKKYLVIYATSDEETKARALYAPNQSEGVGGNPDSSNAGLWGLDEDSVIIAVIGMPETLSADPTVAELNLWIDEMEIVVE